MQKRTCANLQKEKQEEKQDSPHTPLQIKEENKKEKIDPHQRRDSEKIQKARRCNVLVKPTLEEVQAYMDKVEEDRFTAVKFWKYYEAKGWMSWMRLNPRLRTLAKRRERTFTPAQVARIVKELGEP